MNVYFNDDIGLKRIVFGTWGGIVSSSTTSLKARFVYETKMVRNLQGEQVVSSAYVMLPVVYVEHADKIIYESKEYNIIGIEKKRDFTTRFYIITLE